MKESKVNTIYPKKIRATLNMGHTWSAGNASVVFEHSRPQDVDSPALIQAIVDSGRFGFDDISPAPEPAPPVRRVASRPTTPVVIVDEFADDDDDGETPTDLPAVDDPPVLETVVNNLPAAAPKAARPAPKKATPKK